MAIFHLICLIFLPLLVVGEGIEDAKTYHSNSTLQWRAAMSAIDSIPWQGSEEVLDVGCGDGKISAYLAEKLPHGALLGIDISEAMIQFASLHYPESNYPHLHFQKLGAAEIDFENRFDRVVSFSALHWVMDQEKVLRAIHRSLRKSGIACIQTYGTGVMNVTVIGDLLIHRDRWAPLFPAYVKQRIFFTEEEYSTLLENVGFKDVSVVGSWHETPFANREALIDFAKPLLNFIRHLPLDLQQEFVEEVVDRIISVAEIGEDGVIYYKTFNLQAVATK